MADHKQHDEDALHEGERYVVMAYIVLAYIVIA